VSGTRTGHALARVGRSIVRRSDVNVARHARRSVYSPAPVDSHDVGVVADRTVGACKETQAGFGLVEVTVAMIIVLMTLTPILEYFSTAGKVVANAAQQRLAAGVLDNELAQEQQSTFPGSWNTSTDTQNWPSTPTSTVTEDGSSFSVYVVGGWCVLSGKAWTNGVVPTNVPPTYHVIVQVDWGSPKSSSQMIEDSTELAVSGAASEPTAGTTVSSCPLGLA